MSPPPTTPPPADDGQLLSAYLEGELDEHAEAELEHRLEQEPRLREALDRTHDVVVRLRGLDDVEPPEGFAHRLHERMGAERSLPALSDARRRRMARWSVVGAAAAVVLVAVVGLTTLGGFPSGEELAMDDSGSDMAPEIAADRFDGEGDEEEIGALEAPSRDADGDAASGAAPAPMTEARLAWEPVLLDEWVGMDDETAAGRRYSDLPEANQVLGVPSRDAPRLSRESADAIGAAPAFGSGPHPSHCLSAIVDDEIVIVRVETALHEGQQAIAYVGVTSAPGSEVLDRIHVQVTMIADCATRLRTTLVPD